MNKRAAVSIIAFILIIIIATSPFWFWQIKGSKVLPVLIMDKTVSDQTYREHKGLAWILNNQKYVKQNKEKYVAESDYKGFKPMGGTDYKISALPDDLNKYQLIYLTDQYGVYEEEFYGSNKLGERSDKLYGGLDLEDVSKIEDSLYQSNNKTLIAEFNTFASPTSDKAREKITNLLDLKWSGWIGRSFLELDGDEVPVWVKENYEKIYDEKWTFNGSGIVLVNKDDYIVVLSGKELTNSKVKFKTTEKGKAQLGKNLSSEYGYWFDIVESNRKENILANYTIAATKKGKEKLAGYDLPTSLPAIIQNVNNQYTSYYFAGDYADEQEVPSIYQTVGFDLWKEKITYRNSFYWNTYVPLMKSILKNGLHEKVQKDTVETTTVNNVKINSKTNNEYLEVKKNGKWEKILIKGVNMGISKPGAFPGETAITKDEYLRWFKQIGTMHANAIRIYTLHPPAFYEAFYEYNQTAKEPLYLFHGAWVNEEIFVGKQDAYHKEVVEDFQKELKNMIDIVHGNASLRKQTGHASGEYKYDISKYVLGYIIGIEWDPDVVSNTNSAHKGKEQYSGTYFQTTNGSLFEIWLASMMDYTAKYEGEKYNWQHTMSFTNWVTTDLLEHPSEPSEKEDKATVNPNHINKKDDFQAGLFASYHIYPYYPDFLNYEKDYQNYVNKQGEKSSYGAYLHDLISVHTMPVLVAEFGVPSSRGKTHENINDMNQGFLSEEEQGIMDTKLMQMIVDEKYAGGLVFTWQDEWFKRTWNTMDYDNPNRRPYWSNIQTNEQHFGLLSFDPGKYEPTIYVDGQDSDWKKLNMKPLYQNNSEDENLKEIMVTSDEQQLNIKMTYKQPVDITEDSTYLLFNTIEGQGQKKIKLTDDLQINTDFGVDFMAKIADKENSELLIDSYYDTFYYQYGFMLKMINQQKNADKVNNGVFNPIRLALNKELTIPDKKIPFSSYETGKLMYGNGNPNSKNFNSLTDISISKDKKTIELRIPWALLNIKDPSQKEITADLWKKGLEGSEYIDGIQLAFISVKGNKIVSSLPSLHESKMIKEDDMKIYKWDNWEEPLYHERLKQSYYILQKTFSKIEN
ncbi:hypothetical protein [Niallia nealsonii]|uniref:Uncharacterized protein n=1 Tax=Niallia nealsonii TaxID=115979 RepID=A0A2N0Z7A0_9BACI|nr:hypothetical protein [Niallia nealsonii]PKG25381.1 hypothetical protein CWS01_00640 [Niallia nealsonii]